MCLTNQSLWNFRTEDRGRACPHRGFLLIAGEANRLCRSWWKHCSMGAGLQPETLRNTRQTWIYRWWGYLFHGHFGCFLMCAIGWTLLSCVTMTLFRCSVPGAAHPGLSRSAEWPGTQRLPAPHPHTLHLSPKWVWGFLKVYFKAVGV